MRTPFSPVALTPTSLLERAATSFAARTAVVGDEGRLTYGELLDRCERLAGALVGLGIRSGDVVSVLAPNTHVLLEAHFGVPWADAVLNALNIRLSANELGYIVDHAEAKVLIVDHELFELGTQLVAGRPELRLIVAGGHDDTLEAALGAANPTRVGLGDEHQLLALNYTSGTTGRPKGVMYSHRGAYLQAIAMSAHARLTPSTVFLWTLPMFHCNGWCFPWAVTVAGGTHVELRRVEPERIWDAIRSEGVTHFNAAPTVLSSIGYGPWADAGPAERSVSVMTGGAPPSPALLARMADLNLHVTHLYGLTESYGPAVICDWQPEWDHLDDTAKARIRARQGVVNQIGMPLRVIDADGRDVPRDGASLGEVVLRGNNVMIGYYRDEAATVAANVDGWLRTGDIGVLHPDGYLELRDRAKDVIVSGGENIASIEVEQALASHPAVLECAVVAAPDDHWGEVPYAYVTLQPGASVTEDELVEHVRAQLARFKAPKHIALGELPKTSTGKIQKFKLRAGLWPTAGVARTDHHEPNG